MKDFLKEGVKIGEGGVKEEVKTDEEDVKIDEEDLLTVGEW